MPKVLVIYASTHGHTGRIAARIGAALEQEGVAVELHDVRARGAHPAPHAYIDALVEKTGWTPASTATFAGALQYREYDFVTRLMMRLLMRHMHHETDASR